MTMFFNDLLDNKNVSELKFSLDGIYNIRQENQINFSQVQPDQNC